MRESIGSTFLYNIIILFVIIVIGLLSATISYYKAFKVNERLLYSIDKFEGYNKLSKNEMEQYLSSIGYTYEVTGQNQCPKTKNGGTLITSTSSKYLYCVYYHSDDRGSNEKNITNRDNKPIYYNYSLISYIYVDLPIAGKFKIPIYTKGERIYNFSDGQSQGARI